MSALSFGKIKGDPDPGKV